MNIQELRLPIYIDRKLEVFISDENEKYILDYIDSSYSKSFLLQHTDIKEHSWHSFDPRNWINKNLPNIPVINTGHGGDHFCKWEDINKTFALIKYAKHLVFSSSCYVHCADALGKTIDMINYGRPDRKVWPLDINKVLNIREAGKWIRINGKWTKDYKK